MKKATIILIVITAIIIALSITLIVINTKGINAYGMIKQTGNTYVIELEVRDCELNNETLIIINPSIIASHAGEKLEVIGQTTLNYITINSINTTYDPKSACFAIHENDIQPKPLNYQLTQNNPTIIRYNITNNQDQRLFYDCKMLIDCNLSRTYYTGYLKPGDVKEVYFNITCPQGNHTATIQTDFVDELTNRHTVTQNITINAN